MENTKNSKFLRLPQVLEYIPVARSTWWAGVKDGRFPQPVKLSPRVTVWRFEDIKQLIDSLNPGSNESSNS